MTTHSNAPSQASRPQPAAVQLTAEERKLVQQISRQAPARPNKAASLVRRLVSTPFVMV